MPDKKEFLSFGFRLFLYLLAGIVLSDLLFYYITDHSLGSTYYDALVVLEVSRQTSMLFFFSVGAVVYLAALVLVFIASIVMSHRISGPMYRLMVCASSVAEGDLTTRATLRAGDQLKPQAEEFNAVVSSMRERVALCESLAGEIRDKSFVLEGSAGGGECSAEKTRDIVNGMKASAAKLRETLSHYKQD